MKASSRKSPLGFFVFAVTVLVVAMASVLSAEAEPGDGGGVVHGGGGGTFIISKQTKQLVFWDIYLRNPEFTESRRGDQIVLSSAGAAARGEWVDYSRFESFRLLKSRLDMWRSKVPNIVGLIDETIAERGTSFIATSMSIQSVEELSGDHWHYELDPIATPGAYFEYSTGRLLVDTKIWNQVGVRSQAAMLLHEILRALQPKFAMLNFEVQDVTQQIMLDSPEYVSADPLVRDHITDYLYVPSRRQNVSLPLAKPGHTDSLIADLEVSSAIASGVLGEKQIMAQPNSHGHFNPAPPDMHEFRPIVN